MSLACAPRSLGCAAADRAHQGHARLAPARQAPHPRAPAPACPSPGARFSKLQALPGVGDQLDSETRSELPGWLSLAAFAAQELAKRQSLG